MILEISNKYNTECIICSAKENENIDLLFDTIIDKILKTKTFLSKQQNKIKDLKIEIKIQNKIKKKLLCYTLIYKMNKFHNIIFKMDYISLLLKFCVVLQLFQ